LTLPGIAGLILSVGMAVDANVLIFERLREELRDGKSIPYAVSEAFRRAWPSIRDGNYSTILTSFILVFVGTSFVKGFAFVLVLGVVVSMFTAIVLVKNIMRFVLERWPEKYLWLLVSGVTPAKKYKQSDKEKTIL
ncbi:MAG TPA: MMPL family transporter, partial [Patescibacteria group bacterium]|nr:MMPL family transporter [Patescibacteria group bacterium]